MTIHVSAASLAGLLTAALSVSGTNQTASSGARSNAPNPTEAVTATGCLRENPTRPGAYILDSIEGSGEKSYRLIGSGSADLKPHVGHKVKVTGTVGAKAPTGGAAPATGATSGGDDQGPAMNVTIVAHVADTCSGRSQ
jgi:hypothetical protein